MKAPTTTVLIDQLLKQFRGMFAQVDDAEGLLMARQTRFPKKRLRRVD